MKRSVRYQLKRFMENHCVLVNGVVRDKATFERYRITKNMLFSMMSQGLIEITPGGIVVTRKGRNAMYPPTKTFKDRYRERRDAGYHFKQVWIHEDDLDRFQEAMRMFK